MKENFEAHQVYPGPTLRDSALAEVPTDLRSDYDEACRVLPYSEKSAAALARRCLQGVLSAEGYTQKDLVVQIEAVLNEGDPAKSLPSSLHSQIDAVRNFGNFSAHRITDVTTLQIIDVEPDEAEWCLDILVEAFDHYYVKPKMAAVKKAALNEKLKSAGKPPAK